MIDRGLVMAGWLPMIVVVISPVWDFCLFRRNIFSCCDNVSSAVVGRCGYAYVSLLSNIGVSAVVGGVDGGLFMSALLSHLLFGSGQFYCSR